MEYAEEEEEKEHGGADPAVGFERCCLIKVGLVYLEHNRVNRFIEDKISMDTCTLPSFEVCALTAAKGVSGSGASIFR